MRRLAVLLVVAAACGKGGESKPAPSGSAPVAVVAPVDAAPAPKIDRLRTVAVQAVPAGVRVEPAPDGPLAVVAMLQITFEGAPVARVMGGQIDPKVIEGEPRRITPLVSFYEAWVKTAPPPGDDGRVVNVAIVPHLGAGVLMDVLGSFAAAGQRNFAMIVNAPDGPAALLVQQAEAAASGATVTLTGDTAAVAYGGDLIIQVKRTDLDAWPKVREVLADYKTRHTGENAVTIAVEDGVPVRDLLAAVVAVQQDDMTGYLFAEVRLMRHVPAPAAASGGGGGGNAAVALQEEDVTAFADLLVGEDGSAGDLDRRVRPGDDLAAQLDEIRLQGQGATIGGGHRGTRVTAGTIDPPVGPLGRISIADKTALDDTSLAVDVVLHKVMSLYMSGLKRCHKDRLKSDPVARGKVKLSFTVGETGRCTAAKASGFDSDLDACFEGQMENWRFPVPKDSDGEATDASFAITLHLVPE